MDYCLFFIDFLFYAISDFLTWRSDIYSAFGQLENGKIKNESICNVKLRVVENGIRFEREIINKLPSFLINYYVYGVSIIRAIFEFLIPIAVGIYAIILLGISN